VKHVHTVGGQSTTDSTTFRDSQLYAVMLLSAPTPLLDYRTGRIEGRRAGGEAPETEVFG